jgi:predicted phosphoribosyltransferase
MPQEVTLVALFPDRCTAGAQLSAQLAPYADRPGTLVLALPPGGVPVAHPVATRLALPLDLIVVRKLCAPGERGMTMGAVTSGGVRILNHDIVRMLGISQFTLEAVEAEERARIEAVEKTLRGDWPPPQIDGRTVIVIDEGMATGATMHWAAKALRRLGAERVIAAAPTASRNAVELVQDSADAVVVIEIPDPYISTARWYESFAPVADEDVVHLLESAAVAFCRAGRSARLH